MRGGQTTSVSPFPPVLVGKYVGMFAVYIRREIYRSNKPVCQGERRWMLMVCGGYRSPLNTSFNIKTESSIGGKYLKFYILFLFYISEISDTKLFYLVYFSMSATYLNSPI